MKLAYFDCFSGISGDMTLGALVDAGCDLEQLRAGLRGLQVPGWELSAEKVRKNGMAATYVHVKTEDQQKHRSLSTILQLLKDSQLAPQVRERAFSMPLTSPAYPPGPYRFRQPRSCRRYPLCWIATMRSTN